MKSKYHSNQKSPKNKAAPTRNSISREGKKKLKKPTASKRKSMAVIKSLGKSIKTNPNETKKRVYSALTKKRPQSTVKSSPGPTAALVQPTTTQSCLKKQKQHVVGIDIEEVPSNTTAVMQSKRDASGVLLCIHNRRTFNCPKCAHQRSFVNFKPQTINDDLDDDV
jgi:hypothetical protein